MDGTKTPNKLEGLVQMNVLGKNGVKIMANPSRKSSRVSTLGGFLTGGKTARFPLDMVGLSVCLLKKLVSSCDPKQDYPVFFHVFSRRVCLFVS